MLRARVRLSSTPFLTLCATAILIAVLLTGCGSSNNNSTSNPGGTSGGGTNGGTGGTGGGSGGGTGGGTGGGGTGGGGTGSGQSTVAYVYVGGSNLNGPGFITGFNVTSDSVAHLLPGSPYAGPAAQVVTNGAFVFATDGTNLQTYTRNPDGSLLLGPSISGVAHNDTPTDSAIGALTLDRTGKDLYAGEINFQGADNDAIASFGVGNGGTLNFIANSAINTDAGGPLTFSQDNRFAFGEGCYFANWDLFAMARQSNGSLQFTNSNAAIPPTGNPNDTVCPEASSASARNFLAVEAGVLGSGTPAPFLATYKINSEGTLALVSNSNVPTTISGTLAFDPSGDFVAVAGTGGIQVFQLTAAGVLAPLGVPQQTSVKFDAARWDSTGHLYAVGNAALYVFNFSQGALTLASGSPYAVSSEGSLAVLPMK